MTLREYCEYIRKLEPKARVVIVPSGEAWTSLRRFYQDRGGIELRLSDLVQEEAWLPMPDEVFTRVRKAMPTQDTSSKAVVLVGLPGYLALLTDENKEAAIVALRKWVDEMSGRETVCVLRVDAKTTTILKNIFANPRYREGKQLIEIDEQIDSNALEGIAARTEVMLVGDQLVSFIPKAYDTFQKYLKFTEEHPSDSSVRKIVVVASEGRELAGLSADVRQVVCLRDFAQVFYDVVDTRLSEDALRWICERGKEGADGVLQTTLRMHFFPEGEVAKRVLCVFDKCKGPEREVLLWLLRRIASKGSYLERIAMHEGVHVGNFRSAYVRGAEECLDELKVHAYERRDAIRKADVNRADADIRQFIARCADESTSRVAGWLNCETEAERAELLRRCGADGVVSNNVKEVYPEAAAYLDTANVFDNAELDEYFREYRELKMTGRVTQEFYMKAKLLTPPSSVLSRDALVQKYIADDSCALLVVDAMGAEWLPMLLVMARARNIGVDSIAVGRTNLPTSTKFNNVCWPYSSRLLQNIKRFDNIAHNGVESHEVRRAEENLAAALDVINSEVLKRVADGLTRFERVLVTADHGSSRLAVLAWQSEPRLAQTLPCEVGAEVADWRYRERAAKGECPLELEETLDGQYWVVRGYDRLPKKGGGQGFEIHGGATLEERLVPVVIFSQTGQFMPKARTGDKRAQIVERDDFDL